MIIIFVTCAVLGLWFLFMTIDMIRSRKAEEENDDDDPEREELEVVPNIEPIYYTQKAA